MSGFSRTAEAVLRPVVIAAAFTLVVAATSAAQAPPRNPAAGRPDAPAESLLAQATKAELELRLDLARDRLYDLLIMQPGTPDALVARLRLARLLALSGDLQAGILECQLLRQELPPEHPLRAQALGLATTLARRLRAAGAPESAYFATLEPMPVREVTGLSEPQLVVFEEEGRFVLLDEGRKRVYRVDADAATQVSVQDPTALAVMPDGAVLVAGKTGLVTVPPSRTIQLTGTWGNKARQVRKIRSIAPLANGDLLVIDRDYDGLLRCQLTAGTCAPVGPSGKYRVIKVGVTDWSYVLDERGQTVRVLDAAQKQIATVGPAVGSARLERVEDIAIDSAHGLYLVEREAKRVHVLALRNAPEGGIGAVVLGSLAVPQQGDQVIRRPSAIGITPSGALMVAGNSSPRMMRWR